MRRAAEGFWTAGNAHDRSPGSEFDATLLANWARPGFAPPLTGEATRDVCFMLFGFALENLVKGILVGRDPQLLSKGYLKKWHVSGHDVVALFLLAKIKVFREEKKLLVRTTRIMEWKGRYPVAMNFDKVGTQNRVIGHIAVSNVWPTDEYTVLYSLYDRAKAVLLQTISGVPPLPVDHNFG